MYGLTMVSKTATANRIPLRIPTSHENTNAYIVDAFPNRIIWIHSGTCTSAYDIFAERERPLVGGTFASSDMEVFLRVVEDTRSSTDISRNGKLKFDREKKKY